MHTELYVLLHEAPNYMAHTESNMRTACSLFYLCLADQACVTD